MSDLYGMRGIKGGIYRERAGQHKQAGMKGIACCIQVEVSQAETTKRISLF